MKNSRLDTPTCSAVKSVNLHDWMTSRDVFPVAFVVATVLGAPVPKLPVSCKYRYAPQRAPQSLPRRLELPMMMLMLLLLLLLLLLPEYARLVASGDPAACMTMMVCSIHAAARSSVHFTAKEAGHCSMLRMTDCAGEHGRRGVGCGAVAALRRWRRGTNW
jgi:hypothetical protein